MVSSRAPLPGPDFRGSFVVDGSNDAFFFEGQTVVGVSSTGERFFDAPTPGPDAATRALAIDGEGHVWAIKGGTQTIVRFDPEAVPPLELEVTDLSPGDQLHCDLTGFHVAHVAARDADSDADRNPNGIETDAGFNPFSSRSPDQALRLPAVIDLFATADGGA